MRALQILGREFQHHAVLVQGVVDHANLTLTKRIGQRIVDIPHAQAQGQQTLAVHHQGGLQSAVFKVRVDVFELIQA